MNKGSLVRKAGLAFIATLIAVAGLAPFAPGASAASNYTQERIGGVDRFDTAALIAAKIAEATPTAVIARADIYPDALTGAFAAAANGDGPLLLTRTEAVPERTLQALQTEGVQNVILLGGPAAISAAVESQLRAAGYNTRRLFGATRYHTASAIARDGAGIIGTIDGERAALLSSGENFPDALSGAPLSFAAGLPSLLTPSDLEGPAAERDFFDSEVVGTLNALNIDQVYILGGPAAVAEDIENQLRIEGFGTTRLQGANRSGTSVEIFEFGMDKGIYTNRRFGLARGDTFPDALAYAPLGGRPRATVAPSSGAADTGGSANGLLLAASHCTLSNEVEQFIIANQATWTQGEILGGPEAICEEVAQQVREAASFGRAALTLDTQQAAPGDTLTGNVTGENIVSVTVQGCGISPAPQTVTRDANGNFSVVIPDSQTTDCTLTFTTTFTDGSSEIDQFPIDITAPGDPNATLSPTSGVSGTTVTSTYSGNRPATITDVASTNCTIGSEGAQTQSRTFTVTGADNTVCQIQTTVTFTDAEGGTAVLTDTFTITPTGTTPPPATGGTQGVGAGPQLQTNGPDLLSATIINGDPNDSIPNQVRYTFDADLSTAPFGCFSVLGFDSDPAVTEDFGTGSSIESGLRTVVVTFPDPVDLRTKTIGTVNGDCVTGTNGILNVLASKPLGGSSVGTASGTTDAPKLVSATPDATGNTQEVVYTFDQPVLCGIAAEFGFVTADGTEERAINCQEVIGNLSQVRVTFDNAQPLVINGVRFFADDPTNVPFDAAVFELNTGDDNALSHAGGTTARPDLTSVNRRAGQFNVFEFNFDAAVGCNAGTFGDFAIYNIDGSREDGDAIGQADSDTCVVTFDGITANEAPLFTFGGVEDNALVSTVGTPVGNTVGGFAISGNTGTNTGAGFTDGPDLLSAQIDDVADRIVFTFDEPVEPISVIPGNFFAVDAQGDAVFGQAVNDVSGNTVTIEFLDTDLVGTVGAGVTNASNGEDATFGVALTDTQADVNSPDSVGRS